MNRKLLIDAIVLLAVGVIGVAGYKLAPLLTPKTDLTLPLSTCDLNHGNCRVELAGGAHLEFSVEPRPIRALKPLLLRARIEGVEARRVEVDFAGVDMKMGYNRPPLASEGDGTFAGQASLPVCITGSMPWEATVLIETPNALIAAPFRFEAASE